MSKTRWSIVWLAFAAGVAAAAQVGKVPPSLDLVSAELSLSLLQAGWFASVFNLLGAALGAFSGSLADRVGVRSTLCSALALLAFGSILGATADSFAPLLFARVVAGAGLLGVSVAGPRWVAEVSAPKDRDIALAVWSAFMPTGVALALAVSPFALPMFGWRGLWIANSVVLVALIVPIALMGRSESSPSVIKSGVFDTLAHALRTPGAWLLAVCFGCYTLQWHALVTWLPLVFRRHGGQSLEYAALMVSLVAIINLVGNLSGGWLVKCGVPRVRVLVGAFAAIGLCGFVAFASPASVAYSLGAALLFSAIGGVVPAVLFGGVARHAPSKGHIATVNGMLMQGSNLGVLAGAPLVAWSVGANTQWTNAGWLLLGFSAFGVVASIALGTIERGQTNRTRTIS